jgi:acetamidase/formamidase
VGVGEGRLGLGGCGRGAFIPTFVGREGERERAFVLSRKKNHALTTHSAKAIWDFEGIFCSSRHIPGVRFAGLIHPGILGCAPSPEILDLWNTREGELIATHTHLNRTVAEPPQPRNVHAGSATGALKEKIGKEGARTIPGRPEHGGNCAQRPHRPNFARC